MVRRYCRCGGAVLQMAIIVNIVRLLLIILTLYLRADVPHDMARASHG